MRRILIFCLATIFSVTSVAAPGTPVSQSVALDFLKKSQLNQRERKFSDLIKEYSSQLTTDELRVLTDIARQVPNGVIPKVTAQTVKNADGGQDLQLQMTAEGQSAVITISQGQDAATIKVTGSLNKKAKTIKFSTQDTPAQMLELEKSLSAESGLQASKKKLKPLMLTAAQVEKLSKKEKRAYFKKLQKLIAAIEKVQAARKAGEKKRATSSIWSLLLNEAVAKPGSPCMIAGYATTYGNDDVCGTSDDNLTDAFVPGSGYTDIKCNTDIYGENAQVVLTTDPPGTCSDKHKDVLDAFPDTIKNKAHFDETRDRATEALALAAEACANMKPTRGGGAEAAACVELNARYEQLSNYECVDMKKFTQKFKSVDCSEPASDDVVIPPEPIQPPPPPDICEGQGAPYEELQCPEECRTKNPNCDLYECECQTPSEPQTDNGTYVKGCTVVKVNDEPAPVHEKPEKKKSGVGGILPFLLVGGAAFLVGFLVGKMFAKTKTKTITKTVNVPVPGPTVTVPVPVPVPVPGPIQYIPYTPPTQHDGIQ